MLAEKSKRDKVTVPNKPIIYTGFVRQRDLAIEVPGSALSPVMAGEVWTEIYDRLAELVNEHHYRMAHPMSPSAIRMG